MADNNREKLNQIEKQTAYELCMRADSRFAEYLFARLRKKLGLGSGANPESSGESTVLNICASLSQEPIIFDVGANDGGYSRTIKRVLNDDCFVHAFEPGEHAFKKLQREFGAKHNMRLNQLALGRQCAEGILYMDAPGSEFASLTARELGHIHIKHNAVEQAVSVVSLDHYCSENHVSNADLIKIDVEGHELDVLHGATNLFETNAVTLVQFEFGGCNIDTRTFLKDFYQFFDKHNFELFRLLANGKLLSISKYRELDEQFITTNYLAAHQSVTLSKQWPDKVVSTYY